MTRFRHRPYVHGRKSKHTPKQAAASMRNFRIFNLRGLSTLAHRLSPARRDAVQAIIDDELRELGVQTQAERREEHQRIWAQIEQRDRERAELDELIPF